MPCSRAGEAKRNPRVFGTSPWRVGAALHSRFHLLEIWKTVWAVLGPIVALTGLAFLLWPQIKIEPSVNPNPTDPLATAFVITNAGNVPVYNVGFACGFPAGLAIGSAFMGGQARLPVLAPGVPITRSCALASAGSDTKAVEITVFYSWPLIRKESEKAAFFRVIRDTSGATHLLPDLRPPGAHYGRFISN